MLRSFIFVAVLTIVAPDYALAADPPALTLYGRSDCKSLQITLPENDWAWLREKRRLVLGVAQPDFPPTR